MIINYFCKFTDRDERRRQLLGLDNPRQLRLGDEPLDDGLLDDPLSGDPAEVAAEGRQRGHGGDLLLLGNDAGSADTTGGDSGVLLGRVEDGGHAGRGVDLADGGVVAGRVGVVLGDDDGAVGHVGLVRALHAVAVAGLLGLLRVASQVIVDL